MSLNRYLNILEKFNNKNNPIANPKKNFNPSYK